MTERSSKTSFVVPAELAGKTLAAAVRAFRGISWSQSGQLIVGRHIRVNATLCLDETRRLRAGEKIDFVEGSLPAVPREKDVRILHVDSDLVVVEKPAGLLSLRRGEECGWSETRKDRQPTLDELLAKMLPSGRVRPVHRLDRDTSGLMLFALSTRGETALIRLFAHHRIERTYLAIVSGRLEPRTIESWLVRDRGDGLRGSLPVTAARSNRDETAQHAVTHFRPIEHAGSAYSLVECRLETGRTHQIRIHLSEAEHMLCGEKLYVRPVPGCNTVADSSGALRQALHSSVLRFTHPFSGQLMTFQSPLPGDLIQLRERLGKETERLLV